ncbi:MAG: dihydropteroate synthase [Desulfonatronovibrionaceae bacterium]
MRPAPFLIAGILNITPDSFLDGGRYLDPDLALARASAMLEQGAHIIDLGGESTRPFSQRVDTHEELHRIMPVLEKILENHAQVNISIDTYKARVADVCLQGGALIINDISACRFDPELIHVLAEHQPGYVLMHSRGRPETMQVNPVYDDVVLEIKQFFEERLNFLIGSGLKENRIVLDPGIGFGKTLNHNLEILKRIREFSDFGLPLYIGLSHKSLWDKMFGLDAEQRGTITQVGTALAASAGVSIHRVHDPGAATRTLETVSQICC